MLSLDQKAQFATKHSGPSVDRGGWAFDDYERHYSFSSPIVFLRFDRSDGN
jgi:hypothetical protein